MARTAVTTRDLLRCRFVRGDGTQPPVIAPSGRRGGAVSIGAVSDVGSHRVTPALVVAYDKSWPVMFESIADAVSRALAGIDHVVEHIGSTAVPGLAAKPIIDLLAVLSRDGDVAAAIRALDQHGWRHEGDGGRSGRESFTVRPDLPYQHLYLVVRGSEQHVLPMRFRDILRTDVRAREQYAELKIRLAPLLMTDRVAYTEGKTELIKTVLGTSQPPSEEDAH